MARGSGRECTQPHLPPGEQVARQRVGDEGACRRGRADGRGCGFADRLLLQQSPRGGLRPGAVDTRAGQRRPQPGLGAGARLPLPGAGRPRGLAGQWRGQPWSGPGLPRARGGRTGYPEPAGHRTASRDRGQLLPPRRGVDRTGPFLVVIATVSLKSARPLPCVRCPGLTSRFLSQPPTEASLSHGTSHLGRMTVRALEVFQRLPCQPGDHHRPPGLRLTPAVSSVTPPPKGTPEQDAQRVGTPIPTGVGTGATFGEQHARFLLKAWPAARRVQGTLPSNAKG